MFRRLIKFGDSSYVISLPKKWIEKNNLNKGDLVICEELQDLSLKILPQGYPTKHVVSETTINITKNDMGIIKHKISSAYINNFGIINLVSDDISPYVQEIRIALDDLVALEIIQQTSKKIVLKDFLDVHDISVPDTLKRIDTIILSVVEDVQAAFHGQNVLERIKQKETDVNRLSFLIWKVLRKSSDPRVREMLDVTFNEIIYYLGTVISMERFADQLKRIARYVDKDIGEDKVNLFLEIIALYREVMKSFYTLDIELAIEIKIRKKEFMNRCEEVCNGEHRDATLSEKLKNMVQQISEIATYVILFPPSQIKN